MTDLNPFSPTEVLTASSVTGPAQNIWVMMTSLLRIENANVLIGRAEALFFVGLRNPGFCPSKQREIGESIRGGTTRTSIGENALYSSLKVYQ